MPYKKTGNFSLFKKSYPEKRKKLQFLCIVDYVMQTKKLNLHANFFLENVCLNTKFDLRLKKTKKFLGQFQFYLDIFKKNCMKIV